MSRVPRSPEFRQQTREVALVAAALLVAFVVYQMQPSAPVAASLSPIERGRLVYISEGCINCHSQYVRPNTADVLMWGPVESLDEMHRQQLPFIGNRRQGPDISQVGGRRSPLWLKAHLFDPREVSGTSIMPSYAFLFRDERGNNLVAYLSSMRAPANSQQLAQQQQWHLSSAAIAEASPEDGHRLFSRYCATCHSAGGHTRNTWRASFVELPAILSAVTPTGVQPAIPAISQIGHFALIVKFGIPNSDMAGHEYLSDTDIASISLWLSQNIAQPIHNP